MPSSYRKVVSGYTVTHDEARELYETGKVEVEDEDGRVEAIVEVSDFDVNRVVEERNEPEDDENDAGDEENEVSAPFDPSDLTVDELDERLDETDLTASELEALGDAEEAGSNRATALDAIDDALTGE